MSTETSPTGIPVKAPPKKIKMSGFGTAPPGRKPIGYRGNHMHGKVLYDPVYPTKKVPRELVPRYPIDWRNGGRALLTFGLALLEGKRVVGHSKALKWQLGGFCSPRCGMECAKSKWRALCAWRVKGPYEHQMLSDGVLTSYKGNVPTNKPLFAVPRPIAIKNRYKSEAMEYDDSSGQFVYSQRQNLHPAFGLLHNRDDKHYAEGEKDYDSESDGEADSAGSDSEGEQWTDKGSVARQER
eukprot:GDKI01039694.1.p1 GENE.GDKI01039694.1~~GDKI01039694.1.p1  ORF type:complete len:240 (+),score=54.84 GDKI01039694.1:119-838(+)